MHLEECDDVSEEGGPGGGEFKLEQCDEDLRDLGADEGRLGLGAVCPQPLEQHVAQAQLLRRIQHRMELAQAGLHSLKYSRLVFFVATSAKASLQADEPDCVVAVCILEELLRTGEHRRGVGLEEVQELRGPVLGVGRRCGFRCDSQK